MERKVRQIISLILTVSLLLCGCSNSENDEAVIETIHAEINTDLITAPSAEYVIACLNNVDTITGIELDDLSESTAISSSGLEKATATIYFSSSLVEETDKSQSVRDQGTPGGGSIDIFATVEDAESRNEYLAGFDNGLLNIGYHSVVGTLVVRTSKHLDKEEQKSFELSIITALTSGEVDPDNIPTIATEPAMVTNATEPETVPTTIQTEPHIFVPHSSDYYLGKNYADAQEQFIGAGFTNVSVLETKLDSDPMTGFTNGYISGIEVDGNFKYDSETPFHPDIPVVIYYRAWDDASLVVTPETPVFEPGQVLSPISSEEYMGMYYEDVIALFTSAGFTNVSAIEFPTIADPMVGYSNGYVGGITINDSYSFDKVTPFTEDVPVVISYATWPENTTVETVPLETAPPVVETEARENMVWIPNSGAKYHSRAGCSNMENPREVTEREAIAMGYTPCKRCY